MRSALITLALVCALSPLHAQTNDVKPTDEKALKSYNTALQLLREREQAAALGEFKKADKQDGGHCYACQKQMMRLGLELDDWKTVELAAQEMIAGAQGDRDAGRPRSRDRWQEGVVQPDRREHRQHDHPGPA